MGMLMQKEHLQPAVPVFDRALCGQNEKTKSAWFTLWFIEKCGNAF